jgi:nucleoside-diphosphate-sugar epimerase
MKVFITGATGYIGSCVTKELVSHGHTVMGLARNDRSAEKVKSLGGTPVQGSLDDLSALTEAAKASDAVIHMAFIHDFADPDHSLSDNVDKDIEALKALAKGLQGTDKKLINSHVSMVGPPGEMFTESMDKHPGLERNRSEDLFKQLAKEGIHVVTMRLPVVVHGEVDPQFIPAQIQFAKMAGFAAYIGDGSQRWPQVHKLDVAKAFRLAVEKSLPIGQVLHPVHELVTVKTIAEAIAKKYGVEAKSAPPVEVEKHLGFIGRVMGLDNPMSNHQTVKVIGWQPSQIGILEDLEKNY